MKTFDEKFVDLIKQSKDKIEDKICHLINKSEMCPCSEGVPCSDCLKYALEIITKV